MGRTVTQLLIINNNVKKQLADCQGYLAALDQNLLQTIAISGSDSYRIRNYSRAVTSYNALIAMTEATNDME